MNIWFVYVDRTDDDRVFYVGKGTYKRVHTRERNNEHWKSIRDKHGWRREKVFGTKNEQAAYDFETELIALYDTFNGWGANHTAGGSCGQTGLKRSDETKRLLRESHLGKTPWNKGKPQSEEHRRKNSECRIGKTYGKRPRKWTEEFIALIKRERMSGLTVKAVAKKYNVSPSSVSNVMNHGMPCMKRKYK